VGCTFWLEVLKTLIGTAAGAILGIGTAFLTWRIQQRRIELAAGNIAVLALGHYLAALKLVTKAVREEQDEMRAEAPNAPPWATVRAPHVAFKRDLTMDLKQLAFLSDRPQLLEGLLHAERLYFDLVETVDEYRRVHLQIQEATAAAFGAAVTVTPARLEAAAGHHLAAQANTLLAAILDHLDNDEEVYRRIASDLSAELEQRLGRSLILRRKQKIAKFKYPSEPHEAQPAPSAPH
jgi:hypothetical protein